MDKKILTLIMTACLLVALAAPTFEELSLNKSKRALEEMNQLTTADLYCRSILRVHIIADGDTLVDQAIKFHIRNELLKEFSFYFAGCRSLKEAKRIISLKKNIMEKTVCDILRECHAEYTASLTAATEYFPERLYDKTLLPAGDYSCLKITLGKGEGRNWWCVMYPPLCLINPETVEEEIEEDEDRIIIRWRIKEYIEGQLKEDLQNLKEHLIELKENILLDNKL